MTARIANGVAAAALGAAAFLDGSNALAEPVRILVAAGNKQGLPAERPLRFADGDAKRVRDVMVSLGGVRREHAIYLADRRMLLKVPPGRYVIQRRAGGMGGVAQVAIAEGEQRKLEERDFTTSALDVVAKKGADADVPDLREMVRDLRDENRRLREELGRGDVAWRTRGVCSPDVQRTDSEQHTVVDLSVERGRRGRS